MKQNRSYFLKSLVLATCLTPVAYAHLGYTGRDFGTFNGLSYSSVTISNQAITGNYGWADAADGNLGDSHKARAFRFHLDNESSITVSFSANPSATTTSVGGLLPGLSIYQGLAGLAPLPATQTTLPSSPDHDGSEASLAWRTDFAKETFGISYDYNATDGSWNALGNWKMGGDGDLPGDFSQLSSFVYKVSSTDADKDGTVTLTTTLSAGDYTILVGGTDIANKLSADAAKAYGVSGTFTINAVPEPQTWALVGLGLAVMAVMVRRKS